MSTPTILNLFTATWAATDVGPRNLELDRQNPDLCAAPDTDHGSIPNLKFSFGAAHNRLEDGLKTLRRETQTIVRSQP
jgi:oxalate decarboxylase